MKVSASKLVLSFGLLAACASAQTLANYQAMVLSQSPSNYFKLDGSLESAVNGSVVLDSFAGGYATDVYRNLSNCWFFVDQSTAFLRYLSPLLAGGGTSNTASTAKGSVSFLFRALSGPNIGGQRALFDATTVNVGTTNHNAFSLFFENETSTEDPNSLKLRFGDSTTTILPAADVAYGSWYYCAVTYDESATSSNKAKWYIGRVGGVLANGVTTNSLDSVAGDGTGLLIGQRANLTGAYRSPGSGRVDEFAIWGRELSSLEISNQFSKLPPALPPGATYQQVVDSQFPKYYFKLDDSLVESVGGVLTLSAVGPSGAFTNDLLGNASDAYSFSATNDALVITNDLLNGGGAGSDANATGIGTISFQFRMLSDTNNSGQRFIFSAPAAEGVSTDNNMLALFLESDTGVNPNSLKVRGGGTTFGNSGSSSPENNVPVAYATNLVPNAWYYFALVYDETGNGVFNTYFGPAGGTLKKWEYNLNNNDMVGDNGWLVIGNMVITNTLFDRAYRGPGSGVVDEFAIWHDALSDAEIGAQFAAMSPTASPTLTIAFAGDNVLLSWPASTPSSYLLEATNVLNSATIQATSWPNAGTPSIVGTNYVVTNTVSSDARFYRLHKP